MADELNRAAPIAAQLDREWVQRTWFECNQDLYVFAQAVEARRAVPVAAQLDAELPPLAWGVVQTVGDMVRNLLTLDQALPIHAAFHVDIEGKRRCRTKPVTISRERVIEGKWVDSARKDVPYAIIVWSKPDERIDGRTAAPTPELRQAAHALIAAFDDPKCSIASVNNYVRDLERALGRTAGTAPEAVVPQFNSDEDLIAWLDTMHECDGNGAIHNRKWEPAQRAIIGIRAIEAKAVSSMDRAELQIEVFKLRAALNATALEGGYKLVPIEPTEAMVHAAEDLPPPRMFGVVYRTMLSAAPSPQENTK